MGDLCFLGLALIVLGLGLAGISKVIEWGDRHASAKWTAEGEGWQMEGYRVRLVEPERWVRKT